MAFAGLAKLGIKLFFNKRVTPGVPAIIKNSKGEILLEKRKKNIVMYPGMWCLPGGLMEYGETIEQTAAREIKEELGVDSKVVGYGKPVAELPNKKYKVHELSVPVFCKISGIPKPLDETSEVKWFKPEEIRGMKLAYSHKQILKNGGLI